VWATLSSLGAPGEDEGNNGQCYAYQQPGVLEQGLEEAHTGQECEDDDCGCKYSQTCFISVQDVLLIVGGIA